ncbi:MAG: hypothetical protein M9941_09010 [Anaerolineae bacterium]|nr:hypothetical protein [Anaerolineae bacterium]
MSTYVYMFWEVREAGAWTYVGKFIHDIEYDGALVPQNSAPDSWGKYNFSVYYAVSGERGFPDDLSETLQNFVNTYWVDANRPSWMTIEEMRAFYEQEGSEQYAHIDFETIQQENGHQSSDIRLVFWADQ